MSYDDFERDYLPWTEVQQYFRDRRDKAKRRAEHHDRYEMRWRRQEGQNFKRKVRKMVDQHCAAIWGIRQIDDWMKKCQMFRHFHQKGLEPFDIYQHRSWVELHKRTIECIRDCRQELTQFIPGTYALGFRVDPCTKIIPEDRVSRRHCGLTKAIDLGLLPKRHVLSGSDGAYRYMKRLLLNQIRPTHMWGIRREVEDDYDEETNKRNMPIVIYFTAEEDSDEIVRKMWQAWEINRVKRALADTTPTKKQAA